MTPPSHFAATSDLQPLFALYSARRFSDMEDLASTLLQRFPDDGNVWKALSVAQQIQGKDAIAALQKAIGLLPRDAELPSNLGALLSDAGRLEEAIDSYRRALAIQPDFADAHGNLGVALMRLKRYDEAIASLQRSLQLKPGFAEAHNNLADALMARARADDALLHYERALALRPSFVQAQRGRGNALREMGRNLDAAEAYRLALALTPDAADLHFMRGNMLADAGQFDDAVAAFRQAVALQPDYLAALANLGVALLRVGQGVDAIAAYKQALVLDPGAIPVLNNLGNALIANSHPDEALAHYRRAIVLAPNDPQARYNLARALRQLGRFDEALDHFRQLVARDPNDFAARSDMLFVQNYMDYRSDADLLDDARAFGIQAALAARPYAAWLRGERGGRGGRGARNEEGARNEDGGRNEEGGRNERNERGARTRLRVGFVSGDLREHPVGYFAQAVLIALAADIDVHVYANSHTEDAISSSIQSTCAGWRSIAGVTDADAAALIHADGIDILIDLAGHTANNRLPLFAWRPAPVQVSWLGYCATTGMAEIDHVLVDPWIAPPGAEAQYVENLWRLPETFLCFTPPALEVAIAPRQDDITFGCFNNLGKLNPGVVKLWARVLHAVPASRLFLKAPQLDAASNRTDITAQFSAHGIDAARLLLEGATPRADYLAAFNRVDIALDPFPYPGGTTSVEGLWMGVPVLSLAGKRALGRQGESILNNLELADWIAVDADDFVVRAVRHAGDRAALAALRVGLRQRLLASPLCDAPRFAQHVAAALHAMWKMRWADDRRL
ncbi:MAG: tetratricopeptide repeat protein [Pseudomonadota bacterium]|nr:tetratricopeptide repeat protein [Pseudomonadota bacterium]